MKNVFLFVLLTTLGSPGLAQQVGAAPRGDFPNIAASTSDEFSQVTDAKVEGWGKAVDPDRDCQFFRSSGALIISTPACQNPHDFSPELSVTNAPRVVRSVTGDFSL